LSAWSDTHHLLRNVQTSCGGRPASDSKATVGMKLTSHLHLLRKLRMKGATTPLPPYAFMAYKGATLAFPLSFIIQDCRLIDIHTFLPEPNSEPTYSYVCNIEGAVNMRRGPTPFSGEVKVRVKIYLYSPSGLSWPILG
jgi:hypothetical protein